MCGSFTIIGVDKESGKAVSCLIHAIPIIAEKAQDGDDQGLEFERALLNVLQWFRDHATDIDSVVLGGELKLFHDDFYNLTHYLQEKCAMYNIPLELAIDSKSRGKDDVFVPAGSRHIFLARTETIA